MAGENKEGEVHELKGRQGYSWIRSKGSGKSYLCPTGSIKDRDKATEAELKAACVDESDSPQND